MSDFLCKIWRGLLQIFTKIVEFVAEAVKVIGNAVVDVLSDLLQAAGSAIGDVFAANPLLWMVVGGVGLFWLFGGGKKEDKPSLSDYRDAIPGSYRELEEMKGTYNV